MKLRYYLLLLSICLAGCKTTNELSQKNKATTTTLICVIEACKESQPLSLYEYRGIGFEKVQASKRIGKDTFQFQVPNDGNRFYYVGQEGKQKMPVILGKEEKVMMTGDCNTMRSTQIPNSKINQDYNTVIEKIRDFSNQSRQQMMAFQRASQTDASKTPAVVEKMKLLDQEKMQYLNDLQKQQPFLAKLMSLATYLSFPNNQGAYPNEVEYFAGSYFSQADLQSSDYNNIPYVFEAFKNFSNTLCSQNIPEDMLYGFLDRELQKIPGDGRAYQNALGGIAMGLQAKNHPGFTKYGDLFLNKYAAANPYSVTIREFKGTVNKARSYAQGAVAPDFTQKTPEGEEMSLSDLKGKVVLIDFWASWCGPCRKENPHVLKVYNKYKDKGFEILGVSLDRSKMPWLKAIEKDGLTWHHVSDLKGWQNEVAKNYSVRSIPHTVLLDENQRIIARNLRGASLEQKLQQIFGE